MHQLLVANGSITAQVASLAEVVASGNGSNHPGRVPWAKAGILVAENTTQGSAYAAVMVTPSHGVRMQYNYTHDTAGLPGPVSVSSPRWLRLPRRRGPGHRLRLARWAHWAEIGTVQLTGLTGSVQAGLFVTSPADDLGANNSSATLATATFGEVHLFGDLPHQTWNNQVEGANTQTYPTQPAGRSWFRQPRGTFTISGSGDIAPQVAGGNLGGSGGTTSRLASGASGSSR